MVESKIKLIEINKFSSKEDVREVLEMSKDIHVANQRWGVLLISHWQWSGILQKINSILSFRTELSNSKCQKYEG